MANCYDSDSYEEDNNVILKLLFGKKYELKDLTFSKYEQKQLNKIIKILDFDCEKLEIKEIGENFIVFYDNKPLLLEIKPFCGSIKRRNHLIRKKNVKIMNQLASVKICEVATIHSKVCEKKNNVTFFVDPLSVLMECDQRLAMNQQHYFEDVIIDFEKIICENKLLDVCDYWVKTTRKSKMLFTALILFLGEKSEKNGIITGQLHNFSIMVL